MISRRGFFGMLAGIALFPKQKQLDWIKYWRPANLVFSPPRRFHKEYAIDEDLYSQTFQCGTGEMGMLYWSKQ